ncbi:hypothetical protein [Candidatus Acidianus copahuensis]|uniref:DUF3888 domain-containing protein n=1 Tax=Candidatus Acidianus copahuensis TaxID=1160895 RepID=A0A031LT73_9CREN|nr:hypothetical protein [Candidatus Acidianus copahuensis]EZQ11006.1 hypothetical protein CM19_02005 [Candidatus Acidianus copahuensis]NON61704.1 hypothetical protein [Acidianus sp. RZ1]
MSVKTREVKKRKSYRSESISAFKEELRAMSFEPIYGDSVKDIMIRLTAKIQELAEGYAYQVEFPKKADIETEGDVYYFNYTVKVKTPFSVKKLGINVQYMMFDEKIWVGMITKVQ